jgi:hypothetical protein
MTEGMAVQVAHFVCSVSLSAALSAYACISSSPVSTCCRQQSQGGSQHITVAVLSMVRV